MAIDVVSRGKRGRVWIKDERDDGVIVMLVCEEADSLLDGILGDKGVGPVVAEPDPHKGGTFPMEFDEPDKPFQLTLDTSKLSSGLQRFRLARFVQRAAELAEEGVGKVTLDEETAESFGWIPEEEPVSA
jgi:hypothetical protein